MVANLGHIDHVEENTRIWIFGVKKEVGNKIFIYLFLVEVFYNQYKRINECFFKCSLKLVYPSIGMNYTHKSIGLLRPKVRLTLFYCLKNQAVAYRPTEECQCANNLDYSSRSLSYKICHANLNNCNFRLEKYKQREGLQPEPVPSTSKEESGDQFEDGQLKSKVLLIRDFWNKNMQALRGIH